jgi:L-threonylcarbamoyladenylate synthase
MNSGNAYTKIIEALKDGKVGLLPSDTIYGLSCSALNEKAIKRIYKLKGRDYDKPLIILLASANQALLLGLESKDLELAWKHWPAPLTAIVPAGKSTPEFLHRGTKTLAVRVPYSDDLRMIMDDIGPLVSTSANPQGKEPAKTKKRAEKYFGSKLDFYVDIGELNGEPSTIVEIKKGKLKIIRQGAFELK